MTPPNSNAIPAPILEAPQLSELHAAIRGYSQQQLIWSSGYLAGLAATGQPLAGADPAAAAQPAATAQTAKPLTILYGSQTGNGEKLAAALHREVESQGLPVRLLNMSDYPTRELADEAWLAIVVSTHGEGDAPDDAELFLEFLQSKRAPRLDGTAYSVLALGDSSYTQFCQTGVDFDTALASLGASATLTRVDCDVDYASAAAAWSKDVLEAYKSYHEDKASSAPRPTHLSVVSDAPLRHGSAVAPLQAEVLVNQQITGSRSSKTVHHIELLVDGGVDYAPGDALAVITRNPPTLVDQLLAVLGAEGSNSVTLGDETVTLAEALATRLEITATSGSFLERYAALADDEDLHAQILDPASRQMLIRNFQIIDVVRQWPFSGSADALVATLRPLVPRRYSIASSPAATPGEIHLTVAEVAYTAFDTEHWGAASSALVSRTTVGDTLEVFVETNSRFRLPVSTETDVIMIGPGTGVAPFRAFVAERDIAGAAGRHWLFFGDREFSEDFLYQLEWQRHLKTGALDRLDLAFSRDQTDKIYVQDRLRENGAEIWQWLQTGAALYVCGDATHMAPDVDAALTALIAEHGALSDTDAEHYLKQLRRDGRYRKDVY
ncbi:MAG: assimilatory sulfite reductase (NADPH) flavoprotein subunit [Pseudomonadota bacterium]